MRCPPYGVIVITIMLLSAALTLAPPDASGQTDPPDLPFPHVYYPGASGLGCPRGSDVVLDITAEHHLLTFIADVQRGADKPRFAHRFLHFEGIPRSMLLRLGAIRTLGVARTYVSCAKMAERHKISSKFPLMITYQVKVVGSNASAWLLVLFEDEELLEIKQEEAS